MNLGLFKLVCQSFFIDVKLSQKLSHHIIVISFFISYRHIITLESHAIRNFKDSVQEHNHQESVIEEGCGAFTKSFVSCDILMKITGVKVSTV